jgi:hypothetical protein
MAPSTNSRLPSVVKLVRSPVSLCGIFGGQIDSVTLFLPVFQLCPVRTILQMVHNQILLPQQPIVSLNNKLQLTDLHDLSFGPYNAG